MVAVPGVIPTGLLGRLGSELVSSTLLQLPPRNPQGQRPSLSSDVNKVSLAKHLFFPIACPPPVLPLLPHPPPPPVLPLLLDPRVRTFCLDDQALLNRHVCLSVERVGDYQTPCDRWTPLVPVLNSYK